MENKKNKILSFFRMIWIFLLVQVASAGTGAEYVSVTARQSEGIMALLRRYHLPTDPDMVQKFQELNADKFQERSDLIANQSYRMPIYIYRFDGRSIRSSLGISDYPRAKRIESYNRMVYRSGLRAQPYQKSGTIWVPFYELERVSSVSVPTELYFGPQYQDIQPIDAALKGNVYYLISGHGGPDPGAIGIRNNIKMYEDEYAYDVTLRLARRLLEHQATVYMIVQDPDDGIRDEPYLRGDRHEYYLGPEPIHLNKGARLRKSAEIVNRLYLTHVNSARSQQAIVIHCDSRPSKKRIDIFFYYKSGSKAGKNLAHLLYKTIHDKYRASQPGRGYEGIVTTRGLYLLNEIIPTTVYIELGNIRNPKDQERFILVNNRQAVANWLCDGLIRARR